MRAAAFALSLAAAACAGAQERADSPARGLDHTMIAVGDLDAAVADFERLGFSIKPGRAHDNGVRNAHVKFPNGSSLELITASAPRDALAEMYVDWLADGGDGPAWWVVYSPDLDALTDPLVALGLEPSRAGGLVLTTVDAPSHRMVFANRLRSPTDGPDYWTHPNTAERFSGVWLAGADADAQILTRLDAPSDVRAACAPFAAEASVVTLPEGDEVAFVSAIPERPPERAVLGATVRVGDLAAAARLLEANGVAYEAVECDAPRLWIAPAAAHGLWLELRE